MEDEEDMSWVGTSTVEEFNGENPCLLCGEGPYREAEYHLYPICGCGQSWYHPACTTQLVKCMYGVCWVETLVCPHFPGCLYGDEAQEEDVGNTEEEEEQEEQEDVGNTEDEEQEEDVELQQAIMKILTLTMLTATT